MPDLNELLRWSIANSTPKDADSAPVDPANEQLAIRFNPSSGSQSTPATMSALHTSDPGHPTDVPSAPPARRSHLTSEMLDVLMGKPDSVTMKEKMAYATDESNPLDLRVEALDDFEMLIESIDNANNLAPLKLWEPLLGLLKSTEDPILEIVCWIIGTSIQNNPKAQAAFHIFSAPAGGLTPILSLIYPATHSASVRARAVYAISAALKHWPLTPSALASDGSAGYNTLRQGVSEQDENVRKKMAFLVHTLTLLAGEKFEAELPKDAVDWVKDRVEGQGEVVDGLRDNGVYTGLLNGLKSQAAQIEYEEWAVMALAHASAKGGLTGDEKADLKAIWDAWGSAGREERGLQGEDATQISALLAA